MIAAWMLYCVLCTAGFSLAAMLAERALLRGRGSIRIVWLSAVAISLLVPGIAFRFADRSVVPTAAPAVETSAPDVQVAAVPATSLQATADVPTQRRASHSWRATLARFDDSLRIVWITLSIAVAFNFFGGILVLRWMRRSWQKRSVLGVPVYISERTGPAVVGAVSPAIVLPRWVLALDPAQLELMLRHEQEHKRAGDGRMLTVAQLALIAMPWNLALWWQILRLRVAVELDCDARVLRQADARAYGDLLLEVARPRRGPVLLGVTAFAERAAQLERRIRLLGRHRASTTHSARAVAGIIGAVALTAAWAAPRPPVPARTIREVPTQPDRPAPAPLPTRAPIAPVAGTPVDKPVAPVKRTTVPTMSIGLDDRVVPCGGASTKETPRVADLAFDVLFAGIKLTSEQASRACDVLIRLQDEQAREDLAMAATVEVNRARRAAVEAQRDSALRALLTSDADRALFEQHRATVSFSVAGAGARSGGAPLVEFVTRGRGGAAVDSVVEWVTAGVRGGRGGRGGGRGGRAGGGGDPTEMVANAAAVINEMTYRRLFEGITLTPEQETIARALISNAQQQTRLEMPPVATVLRVNQARGVVTMSDESAAALDDILSNDADRTTLQSRITKLLLR